MVVSMRVLWLALALNAICFVFGCGSSADDRRDIDATADAAVESDAHADVTIDGDNPTDAGPDGSVCVPGSVIPCYTGPTGTEDVGACKSGFRTCASNGSGYGECIGEVVPTAEVCTTPLDDDCDGQVNNGPDCACAPGEVSSCYSGPAATLDVGACTSGTQVCNPNGTGFGPCFGEVVPTVETCATSIDDDCDGELNEEGDGCVCVPGSTESCYSGPVGTSGIGACSAGTRTCDALGTAWGPCVGEALPQSEQCSTSVDDDCDGEVNEEGTDCVCAPGVTNACYSGPLGTLGVGTCTSGTQTCNALGSGYDGCQGEVTPESETCTTWMDEDCDALPECPGDAIGATSYANLPILAAAGGWPAGPQLVVQVQKSSSESARWIGFDAGNNVDFIWDLPDWALPSSVVQASSDIYGMAGRYRGAPDFGTGPLPPATSSTADGLFVALFSKKPTGALEFFLVQGHPDALQKGSPVHYAPTSVVAGFAAVGANLGAGTIPPGAFIAGFSDGVVGSPFARPVKTAGSGTVTSIAGLSGHSDNGNVHLIGTFQGMIDFGLGTLDGGSGDVFHLYIGSYGNTVVAKRFGGPGVETVVSDSGSQSGFSLLAGTTAGGIDFGGGPLAAGMFIAWIDAGGNHHFSLSIPAPCKPVTVQGSVTPSAYVLADCAAPLDLGSGLLPAGRVLIALQKGFPNGGAIEWSRPWPVTTDLRFVSGATMFAIGRTKGPVDFGTGATVSGPNVFLTSFMP